MFLDSGKGVDKSRNMEHPGTSRNIPEHGIIIIIMRKYVKLTFQQSNETKINWFQLGKLKEQQNKTKQKRNKLKKKMKMCALSEGSQLETNPFLSVRFAINLYNCVPSLIPNVVAHRKPRWWRSNSLIRLWFLYFPH